MITESQLDTIDVICSSSQKVLCTVVHVDLDLLDSPLRDHGFDTYAALKEWRGRRPYERSLWVRRSSDSRCVPEIYALALLRFGAVAPNQNAYWLDGSSTNNTLENVALIEVKAGATGDGRVARSKYGVKSNTPEYRKKYLADPENRTRQRLHARNSARRARGRVTEARTALGQEEYDALAKRIMPPDGRLGNDDDKLMTRFNDPEVQAEIVAQAQMLNDMFGVDMDEALRQARDKVLGIEASPAPAGAAGETKEI